MNSIKNKKVVVQVCLLIWMLFKSEILTLLYLEMDKCWWNLSLLRLLTTFWGLIKNNKFNLQNTKEYIILRFQNKKCNANALSLLIMFADVFTSSLGFMCESIKIYYQRTWSRWQALLNVVRETAKHMGLVSF